MPTGKCGVRAGCAQSATQAQAALCRAHDAAPLRLTSCRSTMVERPLAPGPQDREGSLAMHGAVCVQPAQGVRQGVHHIRDCTQGFSVRA